MKKTISVILTIAMLIGVIPTIQFGSGADEVFELPVIPPWAVEASVAWSLPVFNDTDVPGLTREIILQSDGRIYIESSLPLIPTNWGYGIALLGDFNDNEWDDFDYSEASPEALGANTFSLPLDAHPAYAQAMEDDGGLQIEFFSWSLDADGQWGSTTDTIDMRITRAYLLLSASTPTPPGAPQSFAATPGNGQVSLSWSAPSSNGGAAITGYQVSRDGGTTWVTASTSTAHTFTGLTNGTSYSFRVRALNSAGEGTAASVTATPDNNAETGVNYARLLQYLLYFYDANMCGADVGDESGVNWRGACHTCDASVSTPYGVKDFSGGFHDAGDHIKFSVTSAYATMTMALAYKEFEDAFVKTGQEEHIEIILKRFAEYLRKCTIFKTDGSLEAYMFQMGDGRDHNYWGQPENKNNNGATPTRTAYFITPANPGTNILMGAAGALASTYYLFGDEEDLKCAEALYKAAIDWPKFARADAYDGWFYPRNGSKGGQNGLWKDYGAAAAEWLFLGTGTQSYRTDANDFIATPGVGTGGQDGWPLGWDSVWQIANALRGNTSSPTPSSTTGIQRIRTDINGYASSTPVTNFRFIGAWGSSVLNAGVQFMGLIHNKYTGETTYKNWAKGQTDYIMGVGPTGAGNNGQTFCLVTGYAPNSSKQPHFSGLYNGGSAPSFGGPSDGSAPDLLGNSASRTADRTLVGALVGGPIRSDGLYYDLAGDYIGNEVGITYNAPFIGAVAGLYSAFGDGDTMKPVTSIDGIKQTHIYPKNVGGDTEELTDFIVIDQFGYRPDSTKTAVIRNPKKGADASKSFAPGTSYQVVSEETKTVVYTGAPVHKFAEDADSGDEIWWFDFSSVNTPGRYYILDVQKEVRSFSFNIAEDVYNEVLKHAVRMFYYQRVGIAKTAQHAGAAWADSASHMGAGQDTQARYFFDQNNAGLERDVSGGWYDAGDYNKYTAWTAAYVETMLECYRENPDVFGDNYNIPESNNGIPDIVDEAKWGLDHLLKLQNDGNFALSDAQRPPNYPNSAALSNFNGSMLSVMTLSNINAAGIANPSLSQIAKHASPPSTAAGRTYYGPPNTTATYAGARAFALGAVIFEEFDPAYADKLKTAADKAFTWAENNKNVMFQNNNSSYNSNGLAAGGQEIMDDSVGSRSENRMKAALYMYEMTGDRNKYLTIFETDYQNLPLYNWWGMDHYRTSQNLMYFQYMKQPDANSTLVGQLKNGWPGRNGLIAHFNAPDGNYKATLGKDGYRAHLEDYPWGSNRAKAEMGLMYYFWEEYEIDSGKYKSDAEDYLHYIHGVNPLNTVYLTNMNNYGASKSLNSIYHDWYSPETKWSVVDGTNPGPAPGYLPGGPNGDYTVDGGYNAHRQWMTAADLAVGDYVRDTLSGFPPAKKYMDINHGWPINTWEITEPSLGYQLPYIRLISKFATPVGSSQCSEHELHICSVEITQAPYSIVLHNPTEDSVSCKGLYISQYLSADKTEAFEWQIPVRIIRAKEKIFIKFATHDLGLGRMQIYFDFKLDMDILLSDAAGNILSEWGT
ncbi:MAG: glycoside hydrolase family 9 protein [Oscillospiraceae bacterium]|nr:glycoside hydrolase family 9 protein [Oscillospiraceae bacterium]